MDTSKYPCLGALIGDTIGSVYEFDNIKTTDFQPLFDKRAEYTDDSIMTIAVADWLVNTGRTLTELEDRLVYWAKHFPCPMGGYGGGFRTWLFNPQRLHDFNGKMYEDGKRHPYNSFGNGSAMRASACGWAVYSLEDTLDLAKCSAIITHNHPEGIKGAQATAAAIYLARQGETKEAIRRYIEQTFGYDLQHTCDDIRPYYDWDGSCQGTVPPALLAFFDSHDFEDAIRLAVSLGGDSDTLACITGGIAQAYYKDIPDEIIFEMQQRLPKEFWEVMEQLANKQEMVSRKTFQLLVEGLRLLGMRKEPVMVVMSFLRTEERCRRMMDWIALHHQENPTEEDAIEMAERIAEHYPA